MAPLSPGIPTSFVPRQPTPESRRPQSTGRNLFLIVALFVGGLSLIAAGGTYLYDGYLTNTLEAKSEELALAQRSVNEDQVEEFVRLRDRLTYGQELLDSHLALSGLFNVLETQTLGTVRYSSLELAVAEDGTAQLDIEGTARTFNALAAQSNALAAEKQVRRAIFSGITVNDNATVSFRLTADLDPRLLVAEDPTAAESATGSEAMPEMPPAPSTTTPAAPAATTTP